MGVLDDLVKIDKNGVVKYVGWIEWKHIPIGIMHCPVCLVLDKCWFNNLLKPELPQHENCHCFAKNILKPIANVNSQANCDLKKFTDYIFGDKYDWNGKKHLFEMLGFTKNDSQYLKKEYENQAIENYCNSNYKLDKLDSQGQRINIDITFIKNDRKLVFTSGWMVKPEGKITNNTPLADKRENIWNI